MKVVTLDFETYYDRDYSLSKMTTEEYIRDPRFEVIMMTAQVDDGAPVALVGPAIPVFFDTVGIESCAVCAHNAVFDGAILSFVYGKVPRAYLDTLSMARPKHAKTTGCSLAALARYYGLEEKGTEVQSAIGKHLEDFTADELAAYVEYCKKDTRICRELFKILVRDFPREELRVIDTTIRMYTQPMIVLDYDVLSQHLDAVVATKDQLLERLGVTEFDSVEDAKAMLMSNDKFAEYLRSIGVEPPTKVSQRTGKRAWAFAKTDQAFKELLESDDDRVVAAVEARLGVKTTIEETRTQRLLSAARRGPLPVMLNYYGAHSSRFSGGDKLNIQNFPRGGALREAITLPAGWTVMACDLSQIEARLNAYCAGQTDVIQQFRDKKDIYSEFGTAVYGYRVSKDTPKERQVAKCAVLGLGYGMGKAKFELYSKQQKVHLASDEAAYIVDLYRRKHDKIVKFWSSCDTVLWNMVRGQSGKITDFISYDPEKITLPGGITIMYPALQPLPDGSRGYRYIKDPRSYKKWQSGETEGIQWEYVFGAKLVENCCRRGTLVLTSRGWVPIECVKATDLVFDGVEYVSHKGVVHKGVQECIPVCGAWFTPEHRILENGTWVEASSVQRPDRPEIWAFGGCQMGSSGGKPENNLGMEVRLREGGSSENAGSVRPHKSGQAGSVPGLYTSRDVQGKQSAWYVPHTFLQRMALYASEVYRTYTLCMEKVWWARDFLLRKVGTVRELLRGYVSNIQAWISPRQGGQRWPLLSPELPVGYIQGEQPEQAGRIQGCGCHEGFFGNGYQQVNVVLPTTTWMADGTVTDATEFSEQATERSGTRTVRDDVFDIFDCGPRHRFVCKGSGQPMIAHNCVQALARVVITEHMNEIAKRYKVLFQVHDEIVIAVRDEEVNEAKTFMEQIMQTSPAWAPDMPLGCECKYGKSYKDCK